MEGGMKLIADAVGNIQVPPGGSAGEGDRGPSDQVQHRGGSDVCRGIKQLSPHHFALPIGKQIKANILQMEGGRYIYVL